MAASPAPPPATTSASSAVDSSPSSTSSTSPSGSKLRLMCSYGGHIVPRPLDKTLCYAGGETRIAAIDRRSAYSLSAVTAHLSKSFMNGRPFCLKYQLPNHELDSLISISTDEDLANMIDEYDRLASAASPARLRFFLFPVRSPSPSNSASNSAADLYDPTSEDWFIDALRNVGVVAKGRSTDSADAAAAVGGCGGGALGDSGTSLPESIVLEKNSSFESTSSSASASNSPAIRGGGGGEEGHVGLRLHDVKVPMPTVDSIGSDSSLASPRFSPQAIVYQDASAFIETKVFPVETESNASDRSPRSDLLTPVQVPGYILTKPMEQKHQQAPSPPPPQPQYIHPPSQSHYVTQYYPNPVPVAAPYPTMYHQPYVQPHQPVQYQINKPYPHPVYMMPVPHTQNPYDIPSQGVVPPGHPLVASNPVMVTSPLVYESYKPPPVSAAEYTAPKVYQTPPVVSQPIHMPSDDPLHQVVAFPPVNQPSQPVVSAALETANFISEYEDHMHAQIYKTQPPGPTLPSQLQTATNAAPVMLSEAFAQLHVDNTKL